MIRLPVAAVLGGLLMLLAAARPAAAALILCNRTSYIMDTAVGLAQQATIATRGWFHLEPGQCRNVADAPPAPLVYVHAHTPAIYGRAPLPQGDTIELCVHKKDFDIAHARTCPLSQQVPFSAARPSDGDGGPTVNLAEEAGYDKTQARLAGIQRLLTIAGYDASPIDGVDGAETRAAISKFLNHRELPADAPNSAHFFDTLLAAARNPLGHGFSWCNDTRYTVMAALGVVEMGAIVTRGWYRLAPGRCRRPQLRDDPYRVYSYAVAIRRDGHTVMRGDKPLAWGGKVILCTRAGKFDLANHGGCAGSGLNSTGFVDIKVVGKPATTVHFRDP